MINSSTPVLATVEQPPLFQDISDKLGHTHQDNIFDDREAQPALPTSLSYLGPGLSWHDYDGDQWPDLILPTGKGGTLAVYRNDAGSFTPLANAALGNLA